MVYRTQWICEKKHAAISAALNSTSSDLIEIPEPQNKISWWEIFLASLLIAGAFISVILGAGTLITQTGFSIGLLSISLAAAPYVLAVGCIGFLLVGLWFFYPKDTKASTTMALDDGYSSYRPASFSYRPLKSNPQRQQLPTAISQSPSSFHRPSGKLE